MKYKKLTISLCIAIVCVVAVLLYIFIRPQPRNDQAYVSKEYGHIYIPQSLHFKGKKWDDRNALDPEINSAWDYVYTYSGTARQIAGDLKKGLKNQGYTVEDETNSSTAEGIFLSAKSNKLELWISVGVNAGSLQSVPQAGNEVLIEAERAE